MQKRGVFGTVAALAAVALIALSGCARSEGSSDASASGFEEGSFIGVALPQKTSENWVLAEKLFTEQINEAGFTGQVDFANAGVAEQQNQISSMVTKGAKVIIVGAIDGSQLGEQLKQAREAGVVVIAYDRLLQNTTDVDYHVSFDSFTIGQLQGESLLKGLATRKPEGPYNVELFAGSSDDANAKVFFEGAMDVLQPKIDDGTIVIPSRQTEFNQAVTLGWRPENAQERMDSLLTSNYSSATLDGVLSPNDTIARTIIASVTAAGKPLPIVTGQDSDVESVRSIMAGEQYSTVDKDTGKQVAATMDLVKRLAAGEPPETNGTSQSDVKEIPAILLDPILVTRENAAEVYRDNAAREPLTR